MKKKINDLMSPSHWTSVWHSRVPENHAERIKRAVNHWAHGDLFAWIVRMIDETPTAPQRIIELGCAPGTMLTSICRLRPQHRYFGLDYSGEGLEITRKTLNEKRIRADLIHADIQTYVSDQRFDIAMSFGLVEHFDDPVGIIAAHKKFVDENGRIAVVVPNLSHRWVVKALSNFRPIDLQTHHLGIMSKTALYAAFVESGLREIRAGGICGPWLPTPKETPTIRSKAYHLFSHAWDGCSRFIPARITWNGYFWATGIV